MPLKTILEEETGIVITYATGVIQKQEALDEIHYIWQTFEPVTLRGLADFSQADVSQLTYKDLVEIAKLSNSYDLHGSSKLAMVGNSLLAYGIGRMYITIRQALQKSPRVMEIFRDVDSAKRWLAEVDED